MYPTTRVMFHDVSKLWNILTVLISRVSYHTAFPHTYHTVQPLSSWIHQDQLPCQPRCSFRHGMPCYCMPDGSTANTIRQEMTSSYMRGDQRASDLQMSCSIYMYLYERCTGSSPQPDRTRFNLSRSRSLIPTISPTSSSSI